MHLNWIDFFVIAAYAVMVLFVGWWSSRRSHSSEDYFLAGRGAGAILVGVSMIVSMFSTISYLGTSAEMIVYGPGLSWGYFHAPITYLVVAYFVIPRIMRYKVTSGYELLEGRFGPNIRQAASVLFVLSRIIWMGFIIFTCSTAIAAVTNLPLPWILAGVGIITTLYTAMGGIRAVLITDALQFFILLLGGILVIAFVTYRFGGFGWWPWNDPAKIADLHWPTLKLFSLNPFDRVTILGALLTSSLWWVCAASSDQMMIQRYLCTRNVKQARRSFFNCLIAEGVIAMVLWGIAVALLGYYMRFPEQRPYQALTITQQANKLFPAFIATQMPAGLRAIILAALCAAAMGSLSSGISALGTVLVVDFKNVFAKGLASDDSRLTIRAKWIGLAVGAVAIMASYIIVYVPGRNLFDVLYRVANLFSVPLFVLFAMAFYVPITTRAGAWAAIFSGVASGILFSYWKQIIGLFTTTGEFSVIMIMPAALTVSLVIGIITSLLVRDFRADGKMLIEADRSDDSNQPTGAEVAADAR